MPYDFSKLHRWDKDGNPIDLRTWMKLIRDDSYKFIRFDSVRSPIKPDPSTMPSKRRGGEWEKWGYVLDKTLIFDVEVTTVWLGDNSNDEMLAISGALDINSPDYKPRIFGTLIHSLGYEFRHSTLTEALERHIYIVKAMKNGDKKAVDLLFAKYGV